MELRIEKATDCTYIKLFDDEDLTDFRVAGFPGSWDVTLSVDLGCKKYVEPISITASEMNPDISGGVNILINSTLLGVETLDEGVYGLTLSVTRPDGSNNTDSVCTALTCAAWCRAIQRLSQDIKTYEAAYKLLDALNYLEECDECDCKYGCAIYDKAIEILDNDVQEDPCNCK